MGAWGYRPFENDSAGDWLGALIEEPMVKAILKALKKVKPNYWNFEEGIAAASLLAENCRSGRHPNLGYYALEYGVFAWGVLAIEVIQKQETWVSGFDDPEKMRAQLKSLRRSLLSLQSSERKRQAKALSCLVYPKAKTAA